MFEWDSNNLRKIRAHRIKREVAEQAFLNDPIPNYVQRKPEELEQKGDRAKESRLVTKLNRKSKQVTIRLQEAEVPKARKLAEGKGFGYQASLKMLVQEGGVREARRG